MHDWDWNTAVLLLPFTHSGTNVKALQIGRLSYLYFLLLIGIRTVRDTRLEDCRIYTSFYIKKTFETDSDAGDLKWLTIEVELEAFLDY